MILSLTCVGVGVLIVVGVIVVFLYRFKKG